MFLFLGEDGSIAQNVEGFILVQLCNKNADPVVFLEFTRWFNRELTSASQLTLATELVSATLQIWKREEYIDREVLLKIITLCKNSVISTENLTTVLKRFWAEAPEPRTTRLHEEILTETWEHTGISCKDLEVLRFHGPKDSLTRVLASVNLGISTLQ